MVSRGVKAAFYTVFRYPLKASGAVYRATLAPKAGEVKVHLGPGQRHYIAGWYNVDANLFSAKVDVWADLRDPLPFRDGTVDAFYSHHVIEHLPDDFLPVHFQHMFRCLKPGGVIRVGGPNAEAAARMLLEGNADWFGEFPRRRESIGGRFANFLMCAGEHLTLLTRSYLEELASNAGFCRVTACLPKQSGHSSIFTPEALDQEGESTPEAPHTIMIEAEKPVNGA